MNLLKRATLNFVVRYFLDYVRREKVEKIREALKGYKTIFLAIGAIVTVIVAWSNGAMETVEAIKAIIEALFAVTIRAGIGNKS